MLFTVISIGSFVCSCVYYIIVFDKLQVFLCDRTFRPNIIVSFCLICRYSQGIKFPPMADIFLSCHRRAFSIVRFFTGLCLHAAGVLSCACLPNGRRPGGLSPGVTVTPVCGRRRGSGRRPSGRYRKNKSARGSRTARRFWRCSGWIPSAGAARSGSGSGSGIPAASCTARS